VLTSVGADAVVKVFSGRVAVAVTGSTESNMGDTSSLVSRESFSSAPASSAPINAVADNTDGTPDDSALPPQADMTAAASLPVRIGSEPTGFKDDATPGEGGDMESMGAGMASFAGRYARGGRARGRGASSIAKLRAGTREQADIN
jgi:hypothetical protein